MEALLKNLKEHVSCSICLDTYTDPKTIDCLHTFCCECLKKHALTSQRQGLYRCPECNAQVDIPEGNRFDRLPSSFLHNSLLSLLAVRQSGDGSEMSCSLCQKKSAEVDYCFDCEKFMCPDCVKAHDLFRTAAFEHHKVTPVKQFQPEDYEALLKRQSFCSQKYHEREVTRFFCLHCQECVCQVCINTDHKTHDVVPLDKAADDEKTNIIAETDVIKEKIQACSGLIRQIETTEIELETNITTAKRQVSQTAEQMVTKIRENEREAITTLEKTRVLRIEKLNAAKKSVRSLEKQINQALEFANSLVQRSSSSDIMQSKKNLKKRFKELSEAQVPAMPVRSFVKFVARSVPESLSLGSVKTGGTYFLPITAVEGLSQNLQAGVQAVIIVRPEISEEELTASDAEVVVEPADKVASLTVCQKKDGNVPVKFVPKVQGTYQITAKLNGKELVDSPFVVQVKERRLDAVSELLLKGETPLKPRGIAVNSRGMIAVTDSETCSVFIFDKEGIFVRKLDCREKSSEPVHVAYLNDEDILVADEYNHRIQQFNVQTGNFVKGFGKRGTAEGEFSSPACICMDSEERVVVTEFGNSRIQVLTKDFKPLFIFGDSGPEKLDHPLGCVYYRNMFIVCDNRNSCLKVFDSTGKFLYKISEPQFKRPWDLSVDKYGNLLVCDFDDGNIKQFTVDGSCTGKTVAKVKLTPWGITTTPDGRILTTDFKTEKIYVIE
ncbi:E3 ubiquitin-protein ligase TRIM45-like [Oculina patagonica]